MKYPEGWAQRGRDGVMFRDKNNIVRIVIVPGAALTTPAVQAELSTPGGAHHAGPADHGLRAPALKVVYTTESAPTRSRASG